MKNQYLKYGILQNKYLIGAFALGIFMQVIVVITPQLADIFSLVPLNWEQWMYTAFISILPLVIIELQKKMNEIKFGKIVYQNYDKEVKI